MKSSDMRVTRRMVRALIREAAPDGRPGQSVLCETIRHGSMSLEYYLPVDEDRQQPHEQDELYIVQDGSGLLDIEGRWSSWPPAMRCSCRRAPGTASTPSAPGSRPG